MKFFDAISGRRSIRNYTAAAVEKPVIEQLLKAAVQAPSATNSQPWAFAVIQDTNLLQQLSDQAKAFLLKQPLQDPALENYRSLLTNPQFNIFYNAGTLIIIYARQIRLNAVENCSLAAQNLMLTAHGLGLGTCWIGFATPYLNQPEAKQQLEIPAAYTAIAPMITGYPQTVPAAKEKQPPEIIVWR